MAKLGRAGFVLVGALLLAACGSDDADVAPLARFGTFQAASVVIGQKNFSNNLPDAGLPGPTAKTVEMPIGSPLVMDGRLFVPDFGSSRLLIYDSVPTSNFTAATVAVGQPDLVSQGLAVTQVGIAFISGVAGANGRLLLVDTGNSRVLVYNSVPTVSGAPADAVLGDTVFNSAASGCSSTELNGATDVMVAGGKLFMTDGNNHRVLIWNSVPTTSTVPPDVVLGQDDFASCAANDRDQDGAADANPNARTLDGPQGIWSDGTRLAVADSGNNRALIWNSIPTANFTAADLVLGQSGFTSNGAGTGGQRLNGPAAVASDGEQVFVADTLNHRVLIWTSFPLVNGQSADVVLGQAGLDNNAANDDDQDGVPDGSPTARTLQQPFGLSLNGTQLIVPDAVNNRVLIFNAQY